MAKLIDMVKRLNKQRSHLGPGESFVAGCALGPLGVMAGVRAGGIEGSPTAVTTGGAVRAAESWAEAAAAEVGLDDPPVSDIGFDGGRPLILGLTETRVLVFAGSHLGRPKDLLGAWPREDCELRVCRRDGEVAATPAFLGLPDGSWIIGDAPNVEYLAALTAAWDAGT